MKILLLLLFPLFAFGQIEINKDTTINCLDTIDYMITVPNKTTITSNAIQHPMDSEAVPLYYFVHEIMAEEKVLRVYYGTFCLDMN